MPITAAVPGVLVCRLCPLLWSCHWGHALSCLVVLGSPSQTRILGAGPASTLETSTWFCPSAIQRGQPTAILVLCTVLVCAESSLGSSTAVWSSLGSARLGAWPPLQTIRLPGQLNDWPAGPSSDSSCSTLTYDSARTVTSIAKYQTNPPTGPQGSGGRGQMAAGTRTAHGARCKREPAGLMFGIWSKVTAGQHFAASATEAAACVISHPCA